MRIAAVAVIVLLLPADPPARSTVAVSALVAGGRVEIECLRSPAERRRPGTGR